MKKNILKVAFVAAFALVAGYSVYTTQVEKDNLSAFAIANTEALAAGETDKSPCGGPKDADGCKSENTIGCKDTSGCQ